MNDGLSLFSIWAKTAERCDLNPESAPASPRSFHPLIYHLLDVAACAEVLLCHTQPRVERLANHCGVNASDLRSCFLVLIGLHDIGKCARGFQGKELQLWPGCLGKPPEAELSVRHDAAGVWVFSDCNVLAHLASRLFPDLSYSMRLKMIQAVCGHHGEPIDTNFPDIPNPKKSIGSDACKAAGAIAEEIVKLWPGSGCSLEDRFAPMASFWLAGLAVVADWLGSNQTWFPFCPPPTEGDLSSNIRDYWEKEARPKAKQALQGSGLLPASVSSKTGLREIFDNSYCPTPLQSYVETVSLPEGPLFFLIEDMTGAGKTEAAVILAHRLMQKGKATGLHVALPTMATANALFARLASSYRRLFDQGQRPSIVLTHSRRNLMDGFASLPAPLSKWEGNAEEGDDASAIEASAFCADWLARSNKQAFLAQVGAGTIDQSILCVLPARHQSMRLWGLADKVLVIDEAHAYDAYMSKEIERLLKFHAAFGGSAIVLSATLPQNKRAALVNAFLEGAKGRRNTLWKPSKSSYPMVTFASAKGTEEIPLALHERLVREVKVERIGTLDEVHCRALQSANAGAAVAIIRNTVDEAIESYGALSKRFENTLLFHARFAMGDREEIEEKVLNRFGKKANANRNAILVATQVIEQSLDLDFDLLITDLAPIDLLIQRAGRLWRHLHRNRPSSLSEPILLVFSPEPEGEVDPGWPAPHLPKTAFVYKDTALLWRSAKTIFEAGKIVSKASQKCGSYQSGEIRALIEAVYGENALTIPKALQKSELAAIGKSSADRTIAGHNLLELEAGYDWAGSKWESDTKVETRLGEETITLRLGRMKEDKVIPWIHSDGGDIRRFWALSEISLRKSRCSDARNPVGIEKEAIEEARAGWTISEKEMPILVLKPNDPDGHSDVWTGAACDAKGKQMKVFYSKTKGLKFAAEEA